MSCFWFKEQDQISIYRKHTKQKVAQARNSLLEIIKSDNLTSYERNFAQIELVRAYQALYESFRPASNFPSSRITPQIEKIIRKNGGTGF